MPSAAQAGAFPVDPVLRVGPYLLAPLRAVRRDDVAPILGPRPGVYLANSPEPAWYTQFGLHCRQSLGSFSRKQAMFRSMAQGSRWLSMTEDRLAGGTTTPWRSPMGVEHMGHGRWRRRPGQLRMLVQVLRHLWRERHAYSYVMVYNLDLPQFLAAWLAKTVLGKRLVLDYEDDYARVRRSRVKNAVARVLRRTVDAAICIHADMLAQFAGRPTAVVSSFADLTYMQHVACELREGMTWLYAGRMDDVGGIELLPQLVAALRQRLQSFRITLCGSGPLAYKVRAFNLPEVHYFGYVSDAQLRSLIERSDACLVLQRPDHAFSAGSFPSKIETYARHRRPVYALWLQE